MPIYAYRCTNCQFSKDVLQKMNDAALTTCPSCGQETFNKQVTAAGFALKGSGWYVTDFRGGQQSEQKSSSIGGETSVSPAIDTTPNNTNTAATPAATTSSTTTATSTET